MSPLFFVRYHKLFGRPVPESCRQTSPRGANSFPGGPEFPPSEGSVLHYVYQCLFSPGVSVKVTSRVMEMTSDLLESEEGVQLVLRHVHALLGYLGGRVGKTEGTRIEREGGNLQLEFDVLSRYTEVMMECMQKYAASKHTGCMCGCVYIF